jgi:hypothetical protein
MQFTVVLSVEVLEWPIGRNYIIICISVGTAATLASPQFLTFPANLCFPFQQHVVLAGLLKGGV